MAAKQFIINSLIVMAFFVAMVTFASQVAIDNNTDISIIDNPIINKSFIQMGGNLSESQDVAQNNRVSFERDEPINNFDFLFNSIIGVGKILTGSIRNIYDITFGLLAQTLGISPLLLTLGATIVLTVIVLYLWSLYKTGR